MNKNELNSFELWVLKKRSIWFHIVVGYLTCFIWVIIYFYCKIKADRINKIKVEKLNKENEELIKRKNREKTTLIFERKIKVVETSHPKRQKALNDIYFILEQNDTPSISASINDDSLDLFYHEIDSENEQQIGVVYEHISDIKKYYNSPDHKIILEYETEKENDIYTLYIKIKVYN